MGLINKLSDYLFGGNVTKSIENEENTQSQVTKEEVNSFLNSFGIDNRQSKKAINEATYYACMKVLCESLGKLPCKLQQKTKNNGVRMARDHSVYSVLNMRPNPYMTASTFWSTVEFNRNHWGNAYVWIDRTKTNDIKLWILKNSDVEVWFDDKKLLKDCSDVFYRYTFSNQRIVIPSYDMLHFKTSNTLDGIIGVSVQKQLEMTISNGNKSEEMLNSSFDNGFVNKSVLNYTGSLSDANVNELVSLVNDYADSNLTADANKNIIPMPYGFSLAPLSTKLADNQFLQLKQYSALQIASAFGIKPYQIGDYTKSSYASAEAQQLSFYVDTLLYILKSYEEEITYKLLSDKEIAAGYYCKFNVAVILRADLKTQIETLSSGVANFIYTPNEARQILDLETKDGGDKLLGNGASIPVDLAGIQYTGNNNEGKE